MVGGVLSTLTVEAPVPTLPAPSLHCALRVSTPSPLEALLAGQAGSRPELALKLAPGSTQFQVTVTSEVFQPAALAAGVWVRGATGANLSTWTGPKLAL